MAVKEQHSPSNIKSLTVTSLSDGFVMIGFNALGKGDKVWTGVERKDMLFPVQKGSVG